MNEVKLLATIRGITTEGRLRLAGFSIQSIRRSVSLGIFESKLGGLYRTSRKYQVVAEAETYEPGQLVKRLKDGKLVKRQVVSMKGGKVSTIDPDKPGDAEDLDPSEIAKDDDAPAKTGSSIGPSSSSSNPIK